jgi:hypothetical protein
MEYMDRCHRFLCKLDTLGWRRSFHQNLFHAVRVRCCRAAPPRPPRPRARPARPASDKHSRSQDFIRATARSFFKLEKPGTFARMHGMLLQKNNWDCIAQEILISTPRRFGKTISA